MGLFGKEEPETIELEALNGKSLKCQVCGNGTFWQRDAQLHTGVASFFNVEWASPTCTCVICSSCGFIHWFFPQR
jgi:predicted nucleic-acid-binding Zn-ribbon protein